MIRPGGEPRRSRTNEHAALEAELRDWLGRRADEVTPATVRAREVPLPHAPAARRRVPLRWAVPAAALTLAAAGWAVATTGSDAPTPVTVRPAAPAPAATTTDTPSTPATPSESASATPPLEPPAPVDPVDPVTEAPRTIRPPIAPEAPPLRAPERSPSLPSVPPSVPTRAR
ncbi:hypothetical protein [Streptomyces sp. SID3343]|uniref:hypothetical protein n=1 Tax=Streptomyces sp. SID3343 TaxID=2690260 RepID=UPI00136FCCBD|nr:hypothetical protein [Streptomyces sp. SID3343]MYV99395.1 hypothetical protein [Streptomyces sp. SID3343]